MSEFDPTSDGSDAPQGHRAPRAAGTGIGNRWAVAAAGVALLAVAVLISPALGTDADTTPLPGASPSATPSAGTTTSAAPTASGKTKATSAPSASTAPQPGRGLTRTEPEGSISNSLVTQRMNGALNVVREVDKVNVAAADVTTDDTGTIAIVAERSESYDGTDEDLVSSLLGAIELELAVPTAPAGPDVRATVDLQPISISLLAAP